jgi:hypothetical protein
MSKIALLNIKSETITEYVFFCPGCGYAHWVRTNGPRPNWQWNGSLETPTFSPSILINPSNPKGRCHSFVENGRIRFLPDCHHKLAGMTVDLPELED